MIVRYYIYVYMKQIKHSQALNELSYCNVRRKKDWIIINNLLV